MKPVQIILALLGVGLLVAGWHQSRAASAPALASGTGGSAGVARDTITGKPRSGHTGTANINGINVALGAGLFNGMTPPSDEVSTTGKRDVLKTTTSGIQQTNTNTSKYA